MTTIATSSLYSGTINGLNSLDLDTLQVTDINTTNIDGNYFSINTIEANDIQVDNELELTLNGFITIGKNTPEEITITDTQVGYLDGVTSNIQTQIDNITLDTTDIENRLSTAEGEIDIIQTDIISLESNVVTLQNKTQKFDSGGNINQGIVVAGIINASAQEQRINRINFYQQPVGLPELVIATLRANQNKSINDLYLNTYTNDLDIYSNQININCDIKFNDNSIQTTAFTDVLKQQVLDNETNISTNTQNISTNTSNISTNTSNISINANNIATNANDIATNTSNISTNANNIATNTSNISINANNISTNANDIATNTSNIVTNTSNIATNTSNISTNSSNITTLQNKTQKFNSSGNIISGIVVGAIINASAQELRINRINFYQQPVGLPELVIATLRSPTNKSVNDLELNTFDNDLTILSNQININCDIKFNDNSIQTTAFTDTLKQKVLDNETNISTNTANIATNTNDIATNTNDIATNTNDIATNTADIATLYQSLVPVGTIIITAQPLTIAPPSGYDFCIGTLKSTSGKYSALYALIGNTYKGNKPSYSGNFYLPDLRQVYIKGSGQSNTYTTSSLATSTGQYQQQSVQQHKHDYEVPANTNNVTSTSADNRSVYDNTRITTQTTTLRDKNNNIIPSSLDETRPDTVSLNYLIKY